METLFPLYDKLPPGLLAGLPYFLLLICVTSLIVQRRLRRQEQLQLLHEIEKSSGLERQLQALYRDAARGEEAIRQMELQQQRLLEVQQEAEQTHEALTSVRVDKAGLQAALDQAELRQEEQASNLQQTRQQLDQAFENLANRIFDAKSAAFNTLSQDGLKHTLEPLQQQLRDFKTRVENVYEKESRDRLALSHQITDLKALNQQISDDAVQLTEALKGDNKVQGNWGEVVLERLLEASGLRKGHEYDTQVALKNAAGERRNPDVIVHLPDGKDVIIDSKMSLLEYERYFSADDEEQRQSHLRNHASSIKSHIQGLSSKSYENLEGLRTLDFVLLFIPVEMAFLLAFEHEPELFQQAYDKNVIVVSPTTLLATLRTIQSIWRYERQNRNAEEIAQQAGRIHDQVVRISESLEDVGKHLGKAGDAWRQANERLRTGRGNLWVTADKLAQLGAKTRKQLPRDSNSDLDD